LSLDGMSRGRRLAAGVGAMLDARMVLSALVDADYSDTAHHMTCALRPEAPTLDFTRALAALDEYVSTLGRGASAEVLDVRSTLRQAAIAAAGRPTGLFTLEAPTGSGKTLAMLEFALRHIQANPSLRRIIVALPFLSITDQTVREYGRALEDEAAGGQLLEHTSLADWRRTAREDENAPGDLVRRAEEAFSEDWLPPIVVTTTVQLFESLFSNHPGTCRKLCSMANSVILVDEVQALPKPLLSATVRALSRLARGLRLQHRALNRHATSPLTVRAGRERIETETSSSRRRHPVGLSVGGRGQGAEASKGSGSPAGCTRSWCGPGPARPTPRCSLSSSRTSRFQEAARANSWSRCATSKRPRA
jgi:hypothetical protein